MGAHNQMVMYGNIITVTDYSIVFGDLNVNQKAKTCRRQGEGRGA